MNDHQQITAERGRRAADLRAAAVALLEQQAIAAGVMLDIDSDQVVAAGPKSAILYLLNNGAPAATSGDAPDLQSEVRLLVRDIMANLEDRRGVLDDIDDDVMEEIRDSLAQHILDSALIARIEHTPAHVQPVNTSSERVENAAGNEQVERAASPATASGDERANFEAWLRKEGRIQESVLGHGAVFLDDGKAEIPWRAWQVRAAVSAATKPPTEQIADVIERLIGACIMNWHSSDPDDAFNSDNEERRTLVDAVDKALAAKRAATKPTADLSKLTRYEPIHSNEEGSQMAVASSGQWLHVEDVQSLLATKPAAAPLAPEYARNTIECMDAWAKVQGLPTYSELHARAAGDVAGHKPIGSVIDHDRFAGESTIDVYLDIGDDVYGPPTASTIGAAQTADQVRNQALEEAANFCEGEVPCSCCFSEDEIALAQNLASGIRALKRPTTTHNSEAGATQTTEGAGK